MKIKGEDVIWSSGAGRRQRKKRKETVAEAEIARRRWVLTCSWKENEGREMGTYLRGCLCRRRRRCRWCRRRRIALLAPVGVKRKEDGEELGERDYLYCAGGNSQPGSSHQCRRYGNPRRDGSSFNHADCDGSEEER